MELQLIKNIIASRAIGLRPLAVPVRSPSGRLVLFGGDGYVAGEGSTNCTLYYFPIPFVPTSNFYGEVMRGDESVKREGNKFTYTFEGYMTYSYATYGLVRALDLVFTISILKLDDGNVEIVDQNINNLYQKSFNYYIYGALNLNQYSIEEFRNYIPRKVITSEYLISPYTINTCFKTGDSAYIDEQQQIISYIGHLNQGRIFKENGKWYFSTPDLNVFIDYPKNTYIGYHRRETYEI